jgi:lipoate---protein ligase
MISKTKVLWTKTLNPWWNLAVEEYLLNSVEEGECILYLWQNQNTVVIGKNQNPWRECRRELLEKEGGYLARRLSGGGAVFHDTGNLNFTFLMRKEDYTLERQVGVILGAVRKVGIAAEMTGRNDITVEGRKFSGNAFCFRKSNAFHHGTLLVSADMGKLSRYLQVSEEKIKSKGVESVKARVVNLSEYNAGLTIERMGQAFMEAFVQEYGGSPVMSDSTEWMDSAVLQEQYDKYSSWEWRYGEVPGFDIEMDTRFAWGGIEIGLKLDRAVIREAKVYSDAMDEALIGRLPELLKGAVFNSMAMADRLRGAKTDEAGTILLEDIAAWLENKEF